MKKVLQIGDIEDFKEPDSKNGQIIFGRMGDKVWMQNLEILPRDRVNVELEGNQFTIKVKLNDGEFLAVKDVKDIAKKEWVCGDD